MSMVECFFSNRYRDRGELFEGLSIWEEEEYRKLQGTLPVLFLSFAKVKAQDYEEMQFSIASIIFEVYQKNSFLMDGDTLSETEKKYFQSIRPEMSRKRAVNSINALSNLLSRYYGKKIIILLDEYDTPMQEAWLSG